MNYIFPIARFTKPCRFKYKDTEKLEINPLEMLKNNVSPLHEVADFQHC
jgi:hypothetical protein